MAPGIPPADDKLLLYRSPFIVVTVGGRPVLHDFSQHLPDLPDSNAALIAGLHCVVIRPAFNDPVMIENNDHVSRPDNNIQRPDRFNDLRDG